MLGRRQAFKKNFSQVKPLSPGFTLIELLVVLVIIAVVVAAASLLFSNKNRSQTNLKTALDLFRSRAILAQQEAVLSTSAIGIAISNQAYVFYRYTEILPSHTWRWQTLQKDKVLGFNRWPDNVKMNLKLAQGETIDLGPIMPSTPQIIFTPSGQVTHFQLIANDEYQVLAQSNGTITIGGYND